MLKVIVYTFGIMSAILGASISNDGVKVMRHPKGSKLWGFGLASLGAIHCVAGILEIVLNTGSVSKRMFKLVE